MSVKILKGDCLAILPTLAAASINAVVTDPPYGLEFMGKEWDGSDGFRRSLNEADVGRDNAFGRMSARAPEYRTAGTGQKNKPGIGERDTEWVSNQGWNQFRCEACGHLFHGGSPCQCDTPKPVRADNRWNLFQAWCEAWSRECLRVLKPGGHFIAFGGTRTYHRLACAVEDAGFEIRDQIQWLYGSGFPKSRNIGDGRGTALKPAHEPIVLARKPLIGTVAANAEKHGTGALNIDACRVRTDENTERPTADKSSKGIPGGAFGNHLAKGRPMIGVSGGHDLGRWPANVIHDGSEEVLARFPDSRSCDTPSDADCEGTILGGSRTQGQIYPGEDGSAGRFFYTAKANKDDRLKSKHPTVKPVDLIAYLCRLITPPKGTILDPFAGSGTTGMACLREGFDCILIEREAEYVADIERRVAHVSGTDFPLFAGAK